MAIQLKNLHKWEKVVMVIRRHWIAFFFLAVYFFSALILTAIIFAMFGMSSYSLVWMLVFWMFYSMFLYVNWINYELDLFIFTNNRVICVEQVSFLNRAVGETTLDKIQEVGIETKWLLANIFDFGTLSIMTAGATPSFDMTFSPKPLKNSRSINNLVDRYRDALYGWNTWEKKFASMAKFREANEKTDEWIKVKQILQEPEEK